MLHIESHAFGRLIAFKTKVVVDQIELTEIYSSFSSFSRSLSYPRIFTRFGKTDIDTSLFSKAFKALNLEFHLLKPVLLTRSVIGANNKYGQVNPYLRILSQGHLS